jgi:hypothetical protein
MQQAGRTTSPGAGLTDLLSCSIGDSNYLSTDISSDLSLVPLVLGKAP